MFPGEAMAMEMWQMAKKVPEGDGLGENFTIFIFHYAIVLGCRLL